MIPEYKDLNLLVLNTLGFKNLSPRDVDTAYIVGKYYFDFLRSEKKSLSIYIPFYSERTTSFIAKYIYFLDLVLKLHDLNPISDYTGTYLLDFFHWSLKSDQDIRDFFVPFRIENEGILSYGDNNEIQVSSDSLIPLFTKDDILDASTDCNKKFIDILHLSSLLSNEKFINHPILIDFEKPISLFLSKSHFKSNFGSNAIFINGNEIKSTEELRNVVLFLSEENSIDKVLLLKYPYNVDIEPRLYTTVNSIKKKAEIWFKNRFHHENDLEPNELFLLPEEINSANKVIEVDLGLNYEIINTTHTKELFDKIANIKREWRYFEHNKYKYPNPIKWLLYVNRDESSEFWKKQFEIDYPIIRGSLNEEIHNIIDLIFEINWIDLYFNQKREHIIFLPTSRRHSTLIESLRKHLSQKFPIIEDVSEISKESSRYNINDIIVLDPFNIIELSNMKTLCGEFNIVIPVPDFIYFSFQPFIQYLLAKYHFDPLSEGAREWIDPHFGYLSKATASLKYNILDKCRKELISYNKKYSYHPEQVEPIDSEIEFDLSEEEIQEGTVKLLEKRGNITENEKWLVSTNEGKEFILGPNSKIIIYHQGFSVSTKAIILAEGTSFIPYSELNTNYDVELISSKLSKMPITARLWQTTLYRIKELGQKVYELLKERELSITREDYFKHAYLVDKEKVDENILPTSMPRSLNDWSIICRFIGINRRDENLAWISYYGRKDLNRLKKAYEKAISYLYDNSLIGEISNPELIQNVSKIISDTSGIDSSIDIDFKQIAKSVILTVNEHIEFYTVSDINVISES